MQLMHLYSGLSSKRHWLRLGMVPMCSVCLQALQRSLEELQQQSEALQRQVIHLQEERSALRDALDDQGTLVAELQVWGAANCRLT